LKPGIPSERYRPSRQFLKNLISSKATYELANQELETAWKTENPTKELLMFVNIDLI